MGNLVFARVDAGLEGVLDELRQREPIFHTKAFGITAAERESAVASNYWEVGASGRRYSRDFILGGLRANPPMDAESVGWKCSEFGLRRLGPEVYLLTYTLDQKGRITRRSTIWERTGEGWQILFHQGTVVTGEDDDTVPREEEMPRGR